MLYLVVSECQCFSVCVVGHIVGHVKTATGPGGITRHLTMWIVAWVRLQECGKCVSRTGFGWLGWVGRLVGECETLFKGSRRLFERVLGCGWYVGSLEGVIGRERGRSVNVRTIQEGKEGKEGKGKVKRVKKGKEKVKSRGRRVKPR